MALVRVAGESLGEMAWKVYKEEVIKRVMIGIENEYNHEKCELNKWLDTVHIIGSVNVREKVRDYMGLKVEELEEYCDIFGADRAMDTAEKDLYDFPKERRGRIRELLVLSAKRLARRSTIGGEI